MIGLVLLLGGCTAGDGDRPAARPTTEASRDRSTTSVDETGDTTDTSTRPTRTDAESPTSESTRPPRTTPSTTSDATSDTTARTTPETTSGQALAPTSTSSPSAAGTPASEEAGGLGTLGWILLIVLVAGLITAWMIARSRRRSAWDVEAAALESETRTATGTRLPSVLTAETAGQRALSWPPLRTGLIDLTRRWDALAGRASDDRRRNRAGQIRDLLQELVSAMDAENEALATGRDWRLLRPRVDEAGRELSAVLAGVPRQEPPAGGSG
jgi:hypothetical protein